MRLTLKNIVANWIGLAGTAMVGIFLTPFMLHKLGDSGYGLWVLASAFTGYYGILDLGLRSAILRYVARYAAVKDWENLGRVLTTALLAYAAISVVMVFVTIVAAWKFEIWFHVAHDWAGSSKLLLLIFGIGSAVGVPLGAFAGVLEGLQKFTLLNIVQVISSALRALLIVICLSSGYGLVTLAMITVGVNLAGSLTYAAVAYRTFPQLTVRWSNAQLSTFRTLAGFGIVVFWIGIAQQLRFQTDAVVIGGFVSVQAITLFAVGGKLIAYATEAVQVTAQVFTPMSSHYDATNNLDQLRRTLVVGNRYSSFVMLPLAAILLIIGKSIIRVWVGPAYLSGYTVLAILTVPTTLYLVQAASTKTLYGMGRHRTLAIVLLAEGIANLVLSIAFSKPYGINGVALGTAVPLTCTSLFFLPVHLCRTLNMRLRDYLRATYFYPILLSVPFGFTLWITDRVIQARKYAQLLLELVISGLIYVALVFIYFSRKERPEAQHDLVRECVREPSVSALEV
jgi:O-antigen/teichoic acid export membrane protein